MGIRYWVRVNKPTKTVILHKSTCRYCEDEHVNNKNNWWTGPFDSLDDARNYAQSEASKLKTEPVGGKCCKPLG